MRSNCLEFGILVLLVMISENAEGQDLRWAVSGSIGYASLAMDEVNEENRTDVQTWNELGIPLEPFPPLQSSVVFSGRLTYRFQPNFALSISIGNSSTEVNTKYVGQRQTLSMIRSVGSTEMAVAFINYVPSRFSFVDWHAEFNVGYMSAWAKSDAFGTMTLGGPDSTYTVTNVDTKGAYDRLRTFASVGLGATVQIARNLLLGAEGKYRFAKMGRMEGEATRFGETTSETTVEFDYSGLLLSIGLGLGF